jgi:hypothetical protein
VFHDLRGGLHKFAHQDNLGLAAVYKETKGSTAVLHLGRPPGSARHSLRFASDIGCQTFPEGMTKCRNCVVEKYSASTSVTA